MRTAVEDAHARNAPTRTAPVVDAAVVGWVMVRLAELCELISWDERGSMQSASAEPVGYVQLGRRNPPKHVSARDYPLLRAFGADGSGLVQLRTVGQQC